MAGQHASLIEQMVLSEFMLRGLFAAHTRRMRGLYRTRQSHLIEGLRDLFGTNIVLSAKETGMHVILPLARDADDLNISILAARLGVVAHPLSPYYAGSDRRKGLLLGFSAFNSSEIAIGLSRLSHLRHSSEFRALLGRPATV